MSDTSSSSSPIFLQIIETSTPKTVLGTTMKLNGSNYLLCGQVFHIFIGVQNKLAHLLQPSSAATDPSYVIWLTGDLFCDDMAPQSLKEKTSDSFMFLATTKEMWDTLKLMYENEKNSSRVFEIYECLFELKQEESLFPSSVENSRVWLISWRCINLLLLM